MTIEKQIAVERIRRMYSPKIPYIATEPNFPDPLTTVNQHIPERLPAFNRLGKIGFGWVCFRPKLACFGLNRL